MGANNGNDHFNEENLPGDFIEYKRLIIFELKRLNAVVIALDKLQRRLAGEILVLKVKAGIWGLIGSSIPILLALAVYFLQKKFGA